MAVSLRTLPSQTSNIMKQFTTEQLRNELANRGFQTANLWHIDDVLQNYECTFITSNETKENTLDN